MKKITKKEKLKIAQRYISKRAEFKILNEDQLREKYKEKMSETDRLALIDTIQELIYTKAKEQMEDKLVEESSKEILTTLKTGHDKV